MHFLDWTIVGIILLIVGTISLYTRRYVKGVSDFLAAGRVAGRYVVSVASGEASMGLISVVAVWELYYSSGFALSFWHAMATPIVLVMTLTGFCIYRYRESRAMTMGQFFEIRYSKRFRIFAGTLQAISGILNYGLFPAVGARFIVYFCDLPQHLSFFGWQWPTFAVIMAIFLTIAVVITTLGGQLTIMTADCVMGILSFPTYLAVVISIYFNFSWWDQIAPTLQSRGAGLSMLDPFDTYNLRDFNLFFVTVGILNSIYSVMSWSGTQGFNAAARNAHEQKMGRILGTWRSGFVTLMILLLAAAAFAYMNHPDFKGRAEVTEQSLSAKALQDTAKAYAPAGYEGHKLSAEDLKAWQGRLAAADPAGQQTYETIRKQMRVPLAVRDFLPVGVLGAFCAIMIFHMIGTDSSYLHSWGSIIVQDIVLPLRKKAFEPRQQLFWLRLVITLVAVYAFFFSLYFGQVTYILMFFALTGAVYLGGAGSVIIGGLYWNRGTTAGAWTAMITGSTLGVLGFVFMNAWAGTIYPFLANHPDFLAWLTKVVEGFSAPFEPAIKLRVNPEKFFMNGQEVYFMTMVSSILAYVSVSLLTCRERFNMDRMLHRGEYARDDEGKAPAKPPGFGSIRKIFKTLSGIDDQFTKGDKALSISVMVWSLGWGFGTFLVIVVWNAISPWPKEYWTNWFFIAYYVLVTILGTVTTVWFSTGGTIDLYKMFKELKTRETIDGDDGRVIGHVNAAEIAPVEKANGKEEKLSSNA